MRLIDADALNEILKGSFQTENIRSGDNDGYFFQKGWNDAIRFILTSLEKKPTIEDSEPVQKWISVNDRLPKDFVSVLGHMTDAGDFPSVRECYNVGHGFFFPAIKEIHPIDFWMEMPEPPKE